MRENKHRQSISMLAALLILAVFGTAILSVLLAGAGTYRRLTERDQQVYDSRTCAQYIASKIRQAPAPAAVALSRFGESDALVIRETVDGKDYLTRIYCHDGWLMELFTAADGDFAPEDGEKILQAESLTLRKEGDLLLADILCGGETVGVTLYLRSGEGAAI